ncbi:MAG: hypothetical protein ACK43N_21155, partial [Pirellulaceae bacterium]
VSVVLDRRPKHTKPFEMPSRCRSGKPAGMLLFASSWMVQKDQFVRDFALAKATESLQMQGKH